MRTATLQHDCFGSCTPVSEARHGKNHRRTHYDSWKGHGVSSILSEEMLREGTMPWESQLLFLAWCWNGCDPHPQVSGTSQTHGNNNIPLLLIQVAAGCRRKLLPFCLWEERTHKHVAVVLIIVFVLQTLQGLLRVSVKTPQLCFQACVLAKPSITHLLSAFICSYT